MVRVRKHIDETGTYDPPWGDLDRGAFIRLDQNENTRSPPEFVLKALTSYVAAGRLQMYPRYEAFLPKLGEYVGVDASRLIVTNGSDQALEVVMRSFLGTGDRLVVAQPEFPMISHVAATIGATVRGVPFAAGLEFPEAAFYDAAAEGCELIVLVSPNNPTGTSIRLDTIEEVLRRNTETPVLVDEAYFEYTGTTCLGLLDAYPNLIITRTFSKAFAMAGLRLGYIVASRELIGQFLKVRGPFDVNSCALVAAAAQIDRPDHWKGQVEEIMATAKPMLLDFLSTRQVKYNDSPAHFLLVWPRSVEKAVSCLVKRGILVRQMKAPAIQGAFRMSIGTVSETQEFIRAYDSYLEGK